MGDEWADGKGDVLNRGREGLGKEVNAFGRVIGVYDLGRVNISQENSNTTHHLNEFSAADRHDRKFGFWFRCGLIEDHGVCASRGTLKGMRSDQHQLPCRSLP